MYQNFNVMKALTYLLCMALMGTLLNCSTMGDPVTLDEQTLDTENHMMAVFKKPGAIIEIYDFEGQGFEYPIDIDGNGFIDFMLSSGKYEILPADPKINTDYYWLVKKVGLEPVHEANQVTSLPGLFELVCGRYLKLTQAGVQVPGDAINAESTWSSDAAFSLHVTTPLNCSHLGQYIKIDAPNIIGVKFTDGLNSMEEVSYYGWITIKPEYALSEIPSVLPNKWTIMNYGYSHYPGKGVIVD
jgi:hypothetical protein